MHLRVLLLLTICVLTACSNMNNNHESNYKFEEDIEIPIKDRVKKEDILVKEKEVDDNTIVIDKDAFEAEMFETETLEAGDKEYYEQPKTIYFPTYTGYSDNMVSLSNVIGMDYNQYPGISSNQVYLCQGPARIDTETTLYMMNIDQYKLADDSWVWADNTGVDICSELLITFYDTSDNMAEHMEISVGKYEKFDHDAFEKEYPGWEFLKSIILAGSHVELTEPGLYFIGLTLPGDVDRDNINAYVRVLED